MYLEGECARTCVYACSVCACVSIIVYEGRACVCVCVGVHVVGVVCVHVCEDATCEPKHLLLCM